MTRPIAGAGFLRAPFKLLPQPVAHFECRLARECDCHQRVNAPFGVVFKQLQIALDKHARLAGAGARNHDQVFVADVNGVVLFTGRLHGARLWLWLSR